jgi:very-short-patch-repair endonuclease
MAMERGRRYERDCGVTRELVARAREFRGEPTWSEELLWGQLRDRRFHGVKCRRQVVIGPFIIDFCAPQLRVIIEVDGDVHTHQQTGDATRQHWLESAGYRVLRFSAAEIETTLNCCLTILSQTVNPSHSPSPSPNQREIKGDPGAMERGQGGEAP